MNKYYLHDGTEQQGPFSLEELKSKPLTKDTSIWYEGLSEWTTAGMVDELKDLITVSTPPPFASKQTPPPIPKEPVKITKEVTKKRSVSKILVTTIVIFLLLVGGVVVLNVLSDPSGNSIMKVTVNPPNPRIVTQRSGEDKDSELFDYKQGVDCTVLNQGGAGNVLVSCYLNQGEKSFERKQEVYMTENQSSDLHFTFEEAEVLEGDMTYTVNAKAIE